MKKWQCTVCGYIHTGDGPPEKCPVCGADKSDFVEVTPKEDAAPSDAQKGFLDAFPLYNLITDLMIKHHVHPISSHIPNGVAPVAVIFVFLSVIFRFADLGAAAFYNMVFVLLSLPFVIFAGFNEWRKKYKASMTSLFIIKITSAFIVLATAVIIVTWRLIDPGVMQTGSAARSGFLLMHVIMLAATGIAGFIGGKLVFKD